MPRRATVTVAVGVAATIVLVVAASAGSVRLWRVTPSSPDSLTPSFDSLPLTTRPPSTPDRPEVVGDGSSFLQIVAVLTVTLIALVALWLLRGWWRTRGTRPARLGGRGGFDALPFVADDLVVELDVDAARAALADGPPRNAIVQCWLQLEHDAANAGLPRHPAETSTEYVTRVVGAASLDPGPIDALAALYREARFSAHHLEDRHRARAIEALDRVVAALRRREVAAG